MISLLSFLAQWALELVPRAGQLQLIGVQLILFGLLSVCLNLLRRVCDRLLGVDIDIHRLGTVSADNTETNAYDKRRSVVDPPIASIPVAVA